MRNTSVSTPAVARLAACLLTVSLAGWGCSGSPTAPTVVQRPGGPAGDAVTISGQVYASIAPMYPYIENAVVEVDLGEGISAVVTSDAEGFYRITTRRGTITVTTSKDGFEPKQVHFDLSRDTVVNFSLDPR
jgi:hypothetical protein